MLQVLQESNFNGQQLGWQSLDSSPKVDKILHYQYLSFIPNIIYIKLINYFHNNSLADYFSIKKT